MNVRVHPKIRRHDHVRCGNAHERGLNLFALFGRIKKHGLGIGFACHGTCLLRSPVPADVPLLSNPTPETDCFRECLLICFRQPTDFTDGVA